MCVIKHFLVFCIFVDLSFQLLSEEITRTIMLLVKIISHAFAHKMEFSEWCCSSVAIIWVSLEVP